MPPRRGARSALVVGSSVFSLGIDTHAREADLLLKTWTAKSSYAACHCKSESATSHLSILGTYWHIAARHEVAVSEEVEVVGHFDVMISADTLKSVWCWGQFISTLIY